MTTTVTIDRVSYTIEKLESGSIRVSCPAGQSHPMLGPDTGGIDVFEVHPCQQRWYAYWNGKLPPGEQQATGPGRDGEKPWWSSRSWKKKKPEK